MAATAHALDQLMSELAYLDRGQLLALAAAWRGGSEAARIAAWDEVRAALRRSRREKALEQARDMILRWATRPDAITGQEAGAGIAEMLLTDVRRPAMPALIDAAAAILVADQLPADAWLVLIGPWQRAVDRDHHA